MTESCDVLVIGGGFYGLYLADYFSRRFNRVVVCEQGGAAMQRASYNNQARVHQGYHYPRSILTAARSRLNFPRFVEEFPEAIDRSFEQIYAIAHYASKTSASQFWEVMKRIGAPIELADRKIARLFDRQLVAEVFRVVEFAFNSTLLQKTLLERLQQSKVDLRLNASVNLIRQTAQDRVEVRIITPTGEARIEADHVFCCGYAQLNQPTAAAGVSPIALKHELTEMALIEPPAVLRGLGVTLMDGPFFSCMPFPARKLHTLSHVRYTPHGHWHDGGPTYCPAYEVLNDPATRKETAFPHMVRDAARYLPVLAQSEYRDSLWEVKTILPRSEMDDSRPILLRLHHGGIQNYHAVMGGKIDNVYDVLDVIEGQLKWNVN